MVKSSVEIIASVSKPEVNKDRRSNQTEEWIPNDHFPEQTVKIGKGVPDRWKTSLKEMFIRNMDDTSFHGNVEEHNNKFGWTEEAEQALQSMKDHICQLPTLATTMTGETLTIYLSASLSAISAVLMVDRHKKQVITESPIQKILEKPEISGRMAKWAIELGDHTIEYVPRTTVKGQVLADFMTETYGKIENESEKGGEKEENEEVRKTWKLFTDGAFNDEGCGAGLMLTSPEGVELTYALRLEFQTTKNEAEYEALLAGLRLANKMGAKHLEAHVDSLLVANQVNGVYDAKE
ncbi:hypothetical protein L1987_53929 [Smallanthus sonchifolius]|uniref:Uncharacterized protein n=1 Tax=Smallanthus sonchifolius TaxID=185202 RepID=A0ACB9E6U1_9ASTR|nr:hypothetical protein L1987_53929 [Smallanthus sonchifolius]